MTTNQEEKNENAAREDCVIESSECVRVCVCEWELFKDGRVEKGSTILIITAFHLSSHEGEGGGGDSCLGFFAFFAFIYFAIVGSTFAALSSMTCGQRHGQHLRQQQQQREQQQQQSGAKCVWFKLFAYYYATADSL